MRRIGLVILAACGGVQPHRAGGPRIAAGMFASPSSTRYEVRRDDRMPVTVTCKPVSNSATKVRIECDSSLPMVEGTWATTTRGLYYLAAAGEPERDTGGIPVLPDPPLVGEVDATDAAGNVTTAFITRRDGDAWCVDWNTREDASETILITCFDTEGIVRGEQIRKDGDRQTTTYTYTRVPR